MCVSSCKRHLCCSAVSPSSFLQPYSWHAANPIAHFLWSSLLLYLFSAPPAPSLSLSKQPVSCLFSLFFHLRRCLCLPLLLPTTLTLCVCVCSADVRRLRERRQGLCFKHHFQQQHHSQAKTAPLTRRWIDPAACHSAYSKRSFSSKHVIYKKLLSSRGISRGLEVTTRWWSHHTVAAYSNLHCGRWNPLIYTIICIQTKYQ